MDKNGNGSHDGRSCGGDVIYALMILGNEIL